MMKYIFEHKEITSCADCPFVWAILGSSGFDCRGFYCTLYHEPVTDESFGDCDMLRTGADDYSLLLE